MAEKKDNNIIKFGMEKDLKQYNYDLYAKYYDLIELKPECVDAMNTVLDRLLSFYRVRTIHDITCGTGAQVSFLASKGYNVSGSDISKAMLDQAKAKMKDSNISLRTGDMISTRFGLFDAIIAMFNSVGHLTCADLDKSMSNIHQSLKKEGIFIFDIINYNYLAKGEFLGYDFIDTAFTKDGIHYIRFNNIILDDVTGVAHINQKTYVQEVKKQPKVIEQDWDLQLYTSDQLEKMLLKNGFNNIQFLSEDGKSFNKDDSYGILVVASL